LKFYGELIGFDVQDDDIAIAFNDNRCSSVAIYSNKVSSLLANLDI